ncbi:MAG: hypothetical protein ACK5QX_04835, partial [bacterium]
LRILRSIRRRRRGNRSRLRGSNRVAGINLFAFTFSVEFFDNLRREFIVYDWFAVDMLARELSKKVLRIVRVRFRNVPAFFP